MGTIILIDGLSTTGKTTLSEMVSCQIHKITERSVSWFREDCKNHPLASAVDYRLNPECSEDVVKKYKMTLDAWSNFIQYVLITDTINIMDGCFLHELEKFYFRSGLSIEEIMAFYIQISEMLSRINAKLFYLQKADMVTSYKKAFEYREKRWMDYKLRQIERYQEGAIGKIVGDSKNVWAKLRQCKYAMEQVCKALRMENYWLDTSKEDWKQLADWICQKIDILGGNRDEI